MTYSVSDGTDPFIQGINKIDTTQWHMVTTMYKYSTQTATLYVDGVLDNTTGNIPTPYASNAANVYIGMDNPVASPNGYYFNGKIDDIRIYNR